MIWQPVGEAAKKIHTAFIERLNLTLRQGVSF